VNERQRLRSISSHSRLAKNLEGPATDGAYDAIAEPFALCEAMTGLEHVVKGGVGLCRRSAEVCAGDPVRVPGRPLHELDLVAVQVAQVGNCWPVLAAGQLDPVAGDALAHQVGERRGQVVTWTTVWPNPLPSSIEPTDRSSTNSIVATSPSPGRFSITRVVPFSNVARPISRNPTSA
jgi:hypothetical protein